MFVPLPNLDDRRWADLVDEGRALIPVYAPEWTDHNAHDPGITLMELLAWIAETDIYRVNRIPDSHLRAFLALVGMRLLPPQAARAVMLFELKKGAAQAVGLPATTLLDSAAGKFRLRHGISVLPATPASVQVSSGGKFRDVTGDWQRGKPIALFGDDPRAGDSFYLGFDPGLDGSAPINLYFDLSGDKAGLDGRERILDEVALRESACGQPPGGCVETEPVPARPKLPPHHSASVVWEVQTRPGLWREVEAQDHTRSLTLSGLVMLTLPGAAAVARAGVSPRPLAYVRARLASGSFDAAPLARRVLANAVEAEQCAPVHEEWTIAVGVVAVGTPPLPGGVAWLSCEFDQQGKVTSLGFTSEADDALPVRMLAYQPATNAQEGRLTLEARRIGTGTGAPNQHYGLRGPQLCEHDFELYTIESGNLRKWRRRESLLASGAADADYVLDAALASVQFGDGERGRVPPAGATVIAVALETTGAGGNAAADTTFALITDEARDVVSAHNVALIGRGDAAKLKAVAARFNRITNPAAASGGAEAETLAHAEGRAVQTLTRPSRAVTLEDCEALALATPGTSLARAAALANEHPGFQCYAAPGFITLVIVPHLPAGRPTPSAGLLTAVSSYLNRRHVIGTRIEVTGPEYLEVEVHAHVKVFQGQSKTGAREAVTEALRKFFDPLAGGPSRKGWPLGRDVYVSEVVEVIAAVPGVDHVLSLELQVPGCEAQCGNVCLRPLALTVSGTHQIQVS